MTEKRCSSCGETKPRSRYSKNASTNDGLQAWCRACYAEYRRANSEKFMAYNKTYHDKHPEEYAASQRRWREANLEKVLAYTREYSAEYRQANPEKFVVYARRHRALKLGATIDDFDEGLVWDRDGNKCVYCGSTENLTLDHIVPLMGGGSHSPNNLTVACQSCNSSKGTKELSEWLRWKSTRD